MKYILVILAIVIAQKSNAVMGPSFAGPDFNKGELLVKLKGKKLSINRSRSLIQNLLGAANVTAVRNLQTDPKLLKISVADNLSVSDAAEILMSSGEFKYAEPNYIYRALDLPNDKLFGQLWGMSNTGQKDSEGHIGKAGRDIHVAQVWEEGVRGSKDVIVAVIDTGVEWNHEDLKANIFENIGEAGAKANNGIDDDQNGFVDDVHGWDFVEHKNNSNDRHGHGSHCSGTIGGVGNNKKGVTGVNWTVSILPVRFLDENGSGSLEGAVEAINYAKLMGAQIMSNSWGASISSEALAEAVKSTGDKGILFVAAAGNDGVDIGGSPTYPGGYEFENVLTVAATDNLDMLANFSNFSSTKVHVAAPGVNVVSSVLANKYDSFSGTSMATPHVAGAAALILSQNPSWKFGELKERLIATSEPVANLRRKVLSKGRINVYNAIHNIRVPITDPDPSLWETVPYPVIESPHPYLDSHQYDYNVKVPGVKMIRVVFGSLDIEKNYDKLILMDSSGETIDTVDGVATDLASEYVSGNEIKMKLITDHSQNRFGFTVKAVQVIR